MNVHQKDKMLLGRDSQPMNLQRAGAEGSVVLDAQGRRYVDLVMGWCVGNLGWNQRNLQASIKQSRSPTYVHPSYFYKPWVDLASARPRPYGDRSPFVKATRLGGAGPGAPHNFNSLTLLQDLHGIVPASSLHFERHHRYRVSSFRSS